MGNCLQYMGNCLQYICPSSNEQKEPELSVTAAKEEQHATETKASDKPEVPCEKTGRSASCALPSVDVDLPVLTVLGLEGKPQVKNADRNMAENQEKSERTETKDGVQIASGLQVFFFSQVQIPRCHLAMELKLRSRRRYLLYLHQNSCTGIRALSKARKQEIAAASRRKRAERL